MSLLKKMIHITVHELSNDKDYSLELTAMLTGSPESTFLWDNTLMGKRYF